MTDPITDMFNQIRNAQKVFKPKIQLPLSKVKWQVAEILKKQGFLGEVKKKGRGPKKTLSLDLKYQSDKSPALEGFKRISKPGQRIYLKSREIKKVKSGFGLNIVSTSQGIMTGQEARKKKLGGEILVEVW